MAQIAHTGPIHLGLDVHRNAISVATLPPAAASAAVEQIPSDEAAVLAFLGRFAEPGRLRVCYEAGPTGYELARLLHRQGVACQVIAPSLIPRAAGDRVKTDRRDCRRLARLHRAGELVAIRIPTPREEAVRDLCRARADLVDDRSRARRRLQAFLLRHGRVYRAGACWTGKHQRWLGTQQFGDHQLQATFTHYRAVAATRDAQVTAIEADLAEAATKPPFAEAVARLAAYRGVGQLGALSLAAEVGDWRRFAHPGAFMAFTGLVPSERSSGDSVWRGHITRTGSKHLRFQLVESAWSYHHRPLIAGALRERQQHVGADTPARSWAAQLRLCRRFAAAGAPQAHHRCGGGRRRPGTCRVLVGRDAGLSPDAADVGRSPIGATAPASPSSPSEHRRRRHDPRDLTATPRTARRSKSGPRPAHSRLAVPTREHQSGGPPIHAAPTRSWPTSARPPPTGHLESDAPCGHQELLTGSSALDGAVPYQKVKRVGHGFRNFANYRLRLLLHCGVRWQTHRTARLRGRSPHLVA
jgi:transposase